MQQHEKYPRDSTWCFLSRVYWGRSDQIMRYLVRGALMAALTRRSDHFLPQWSRIHWRRSDQTMRYLTLHFEFEAQLILRENRYFLVQLRGAFWVIRGPEMVDFEGMSWSYDALRWRRNGRFWREERAEAEIMNRQDGSEMVDLKQRNGQCVVFFFFVWINRQYIPDKLSRRL